VRPVHPFLFGWAMTRRFTKTQAGWVTAACAFERVDCYVH